MSKTLYTNKKALFDYDVVKNFEAGIILEGWEVKSIRAGHVNLAGSFIKNINGELYLTNGKVTSYKFAKSPGVDSENRNRKLLLNKKEILEISNSLKQAGLTSVPLDLYTTDQGLIKLKIAIVKGRKKFDKRNKIKERDLKRRIDSDRKMLKY